ncbi:hypothetical protein GGI20_002010 [Coemansia sp. BCRC 34301]|nr:hypothetical protein GGI20_002010 [Coemansia sp. BCRC 34301]
MQITCTVSLIVAVMAGGLWGSSRASGMEVDLEWDVGTGAKDITTAMSMLRFANDTAPPGTEWVSLGWNYGTLSLQHRVDSSSFIVMQVSPPTTAHQVLLGKTSDLSEVSYHPTGEGPSQVVLESKVDLDSNLPYYFKVEAHHDVLQNRTIYEGLYSIGNHWMYMGSLVLQHPNKLPPGTTIKAGRINADESSGPELSSESNDAESKSEDSKSEESKSEDDVKSKDDDSDKDQDDDSKSDKEDNDEKDERIQDTGDMTRRRHNVKTSTASQAESESDSDSDSDTESSPPQSMTKPATASSTLPVKKMFECASASSSDMTALRATVRSAFTDFLKSGLRAINPGGKKQPHSRNKRVAISAASKNKEIVGDELLSLLKNEIGFPSFSVFPRLYSGVKRLEGADSALVRAGVYKKFQLRDRLGETFFVTQGRAFAYDGTDNDVSLVRHYFLSSSYLLSLDGPRPATSGDEKQKELSSSSSSSDSAESSSSSSSDATESSSSLTSTAETAVAETTSSS